jgi:general secretion pathway protein G
VLIGIYAGIKTYSSKVAEDKLVELIAKYAGDADIDYKKVSVDLLGMDLRISDVSFRNPADESEGIIINEIVMYDVDDKSSVPTFLSMACNGIELKGIDRIDSTNPLSILAYNDRIKGNINVDYSYDKDKKELCARKLNLKIDDAGELNIAFKLGNINLEPEAIAELPDTYPHALFHEATIMYADDTLLERLLNSIAGKFHIDIKTLKRNLTQGYEQIINSEKDDSTKKSLNEIIKFIQDPHELYISVSPSNPLPISLIKRMGGSSPADAIKLLNIQIKSESHVSKNNAANIYAEKLKESVQDVANEFSVSSNSEPAEKTGTFLGFRFIGKGEKPKPQIARQQIELFGTALDTYKLDVGHYPDSLTMLIETGQEEMSNWRGPYLAKNVIPKDPWGNNYVYKYPGENAEYDLSSYGKDGEEGGEGLNRDINSWEVDYDASKKSKSAVQQTKSPYFAKGKVFQKLEVYNSISSYGDPDGRVMGVLNPGDIVEVMQMILTDRESPYTFKVKTGHGIVGYTLNGFTMTEFIGDKGAIIAVHLDRPYEFEGDVQGVDEMIGKYARFVEGYPKSEFVPEALLNILGLHLETLQSDVDKMSRVDNIIAILKKLSSDAAYPANFRNKAKELLQFVSEHQNDLLGRKVIHETLSKAFDQQRALFSLVPNSMIRTF